LGELRAAFIALKHAHDKVFFQQNLAEILKFAQDSKPSLLFQTYLRRLMEYSQRRSKLESTVFNHIVEQLTPNQKMGIRLKTIFEVAEEKAEKKGRQEGRQEGISIGEAKVQATKRQTIINLIRTTTWENEQIAQIVDVPTASVEAIRLELGKG
jgi:hypothetical protein